MKEKRIVPIEDLKKFSETLLLKAGLSDEHARIMTDSIILADLRGVKSHGIVRLPTYIERIEKGVTIINAPMKYEKNLGAVALLDAANGLGQVAGSLAMNEAMRIARMYGIGMVGVKNSNHFGIASYYSMMALEQGMIGVVLTNASPAIAPFGAVAPLFGTNPVSVTVPAGAERPIVLDMSMSVVARGKIRYADLVGEAIPEGWALDRNGNPTTDAAEALKGSLVPIGGAKGSGLSFVVDILCGLLTGSSKTGEVGNVTDTSGAAKTGHVFMAIDIGHFIELEAFTRSMEEAVARIKSMKSKNGSPIYMAGEIEFGLTDKLLKEGLALDDDVVEALNATALRYKTDRLR
jgi:LDH2 family malate/lactate/ureidoglycolate dehydrogenase